MPDELTEMVAKASALEVGGFHLPLSRRDQAGDGFEPADALHRSGPLLDARIAASTRGTGTELLQVGAQWWFERCAWLVAATALGCAVTSGRVPDLRPEHVLLESRDGVPCGIGVRAMPLDAPRGFDARAADAREAIEGHLRPLVEAITAARLRPARALWRSAGDRVAQAALWVGAAAGSHADARRLAEAMLVPPGPMHVPVRVGTLPTGERGHLRTSCCLSHRTPGGVCAGCPRTRRLDAAITAPSRPG